MRSSESMPKAPADGIPKLWLLVLGDDHPRACTGRRLIAHGQARLFPTRRRRTPVPVVLDPYAPIPLSRQDRSQILRGGLLAVDCSWNRLSVRGTLSDPTNPLLRGGRRRRLPMLVATNPQHYGRLGQLNTAEALAAGLAVSGHLSAAARLLMGFAGGASFLQLNRPRLAAYEEARDPGEILQAERELFRVLPDFRLLSRGTTSST